MCIDSDETNGEEDETNSEEDEFKGSYNCIIIIIIIYTHAFMHRWYE